MDITVTIPDDAKETCATPDGTGDPVAFIQAQCQDAADSFVIGARRLQTNAKLLAAGISSPHLIATEDAEPLVVLLESQKGALTEMKSAGVNRK